MDYSKITADVVRGPEIGKIYMDASPFVTTLARRAYDQFADQVERQFHELTSCKGYGVTVQFQDQDPYPDASAMMDDVRNHARLKIYRTTDDQDHQGMGTVVRSGLHQCRPGSQDHGAHHRV